MPEVIMRPSIKQWDFLNAKEMYVAYGGARGGGKSWVVRLAAIIYAQKYPGSRQLIVRRTYEELKGNHRDPLRAILGKSARYNMQDKEFIFPNGSRIVLSYYDNDGAAMHFQGQEYHVIYVDEATNLREEWIKTLMACCRSSDNYPKHMYFTMNPGGPGHQYFKRLFVDRRFLQGEEPENYRFIQAKVDDNRALMEAMPQYVRFLDQLPPKLKKAWRDGSWDIFEGQYFEEFRDNEDGYKTRQWTHVIDDFKVPKHWDVWRAFDWGRRRPFSCGWYAIDTMGTVYRIAQLYGVQKDANGEAIPNEGLKWTPDETFKAIAEMEQEHPQLAGRHIEGVADPAIWDAETGVSIAETAEKYGLFFEPADHKRIAGWMQCHWRLRFDEEGFPKFYCFRSCREFIRTIPLLQYDEHKVQDLDSSAQDHIADEWRYMLMRHILPADEIPEAKNLPLYGIDPLNQFADD